MYSLPLTNMYYAYKQSFKIEIEEGRTIGGTFKFCSDVIYEWIKRKFPGMELPKKVRTIHKSLVSQNADVIFIPNEQYFCMRTVHQDINDTSRFWITEAEIMNLNNELVLGIRNSYTASEPDNNLTTFGIPVFVRILQSNCILKDGNQRTGELHKITSESELENLFDLIADSARILPVIVIAQDNTTNKDILGFFEDTEGYLVDGKKLAQKLELRAHVFYLPLEFQEEWTKVIGMEWSVFNGAIRTYNPNASFDDSEYYAHPYTLPNRILAMDYVTRDGKICVGGRAFRHILTHRIEEDNVRRRIEWNSLEHKFYFNKSMEQYRKTRPDSGLNDELKEYYKELDIENDQLREENLDLNNKIYISETELEQARNEIQKYVSMNYANQMRIRNLEKQLEEVKGQENGIQYPTEYSQIPQWVDEHFCGRVQLSNRALKALKEAVYGDIELVGKALEFLASEYYDMKLGIGSKETYDAKLEKLYLKDEPAISDVSAGEQGDEYYIMHNGQRKKFDKHLTKGDGRDPRKCLRIYYFWDNETGMVVVGSLPYHLNIRSSN